jgi:Fe-S cluster assembly ATPase SufC
VRDEQDARLAPLADPVDALGDDLERVDVQAGVGLVEHRDLRVEQLELDDLVALLLTTGEALVDVAGAERRVEVELLDPKVAVLDETDSGLDIDALKIVSEGVNRFRAREGKGVLLITHYTRILRYIQPDYVHVFVDGKVAESGGKELADQLEAEGYDKYVKAGV